MARTSPSFLELLEKSKLLTPEQFARAQAVAQELNSEEPRALAKALVQKDLLTRWQAAQLLAGRASFFMGKYKLLDLLGRGGMGGVFLAQHTMMNRTVALKVISRQLGKDPALLERFLTEARAIAALDHPNIIHAYNVDNEGDRYYLVVEYVEGQDLQRMVEADGPLDPEKAVDYTRQAAEGLAHAHGRNMIHCDIKPANLLVSRQGVVKILDMGMARLIGREGNGTEPDERVLGTVDYLAPEQAMDSPTLDHRVDIYSLGCTLYFLLTGQPPFGEGTIHERLVKHQTQEPPSLTELQPGVPKDLAEICGKMMAKDPAQRYQSAEQLVEVLAAWKPPPQSQKLKRAAPIHDAKAGAQAEKKELDATADLADLIDEPTAAPKRKSVKRTKAKGPAFPMETVRALLSDKRRLLWVGGTVAGVLVLAGALGLGVWLGKKSGEKPEAVAAASAEGAESAKGKAKKGAQAAGAAASQEEIKKPDAAKKDVADKTSDTEDHSKAAPEKQPKESDKTADKQEKPSETSKAEPAPKTDNAKPAAKPGTGDGTDSKPEKSEKPSPPSKPADEPAKPAPEPPKPPPVDPFKDFPKAVDLPEESGELAKIHGPADVRWDLTLVGGESVLKGSRTFIMEPKEEDGKQAWLVQLQTDVVGKDPTRTDVAKFSREGQALHFQWLEGTPPTVAGQLRLCALQVRAGDESRSLTLFTPQPLEPIPLELDRGGINKPVKLAWLPDSGKLLVQVTKVSDLKGFPSVIEPADPQAPGKPVSIKFAGDSAATAVSLSVMFTTRGSGLQAGIRLPKGMAAQFKQLSTMPAGITMDELEKKHKEAVDKAKPAEKPMIEKTFAIMADKLWFMEFARSAKMGKVHYKLLAQVGDETKVVASTPGADEPEKIDRPKPAPKRK